MPGYSNEYFRPVVSYPTELKTWVITFGSGDWILDSCSGQQGNESGFIAAQSGIGRKDTRYLSPAPAKIIDFLGYHPRPMPETLPERLGWYRKSKGWSQKLFAEVLGVDQSTLARWERGERNPQGDQLAGGRKVLGTVGD